MTMPQLDNAYTMEGGYLVSAKVSRIIAAIRDYEPELDVKWVPPGARREGQAAFAIVHRPLGGSEYVLFYVPKEEDFDERVLHKIIANDQRKGEHTWDDFTAAERTRELVGKQQKLDEMEQAADIMYHVLRSPLNTYKVNDKFVVKDGIPFNAAGK